VAVAIDPPLEDVMNRIIFLVLAVATMFGLYQCTKIKPKDTKFNPVLVAEIKRLNTDENPLCADLYPVEAFPYLAPVKFSGYSSDNEKPLPEDPLGVKWNDLVAAGLVTVAEKIDLDMKIVGYEYSLTAKGREFYQPRKLPSGKMRARFCLGQPVLKQISAISKPVYSIEGLNLTVRYTLRVEKGSPVLYDGTAQALGLKVPTRNQQGEIEFPEIVAVFVLHRDTGKVLSWQPL